MGRVWGRVKMKERKGERERERKREKKKKRKRERDKDRKCFWHRTQILSSFGIGIFSFIVAATTSLLRINSSL